MFLAIGLWFVPAVLEVYHTMHWIPPLDRFSSSNSYEILVADACRLVWAIAHPSPLLLLEISSVCSLICIDRCPSGYKFFEAGTLRNHFLAQRLLSYNWFSPIKEDLPCEMYDQNLERSHYLYLGSSMDRSCSSSRPPSWYSAIETRPWSELRCISDCVYFSPQMRRPFEGEVSSKKSHFWRSW